MASAELELSKKENVMAEESVSELKNDHDQSKAGVSEDSGNKDDKSGDGKGTEEKFVVNNDSSSKPSESVKMNRPTAQPTKRRPDKELNHDNWDVEDEPEEKGEFKKATDEELKGRRILTARRKQKPSDSGSSNPFGGISFGSGAANGKSSAQCPASLFNFSSNAPVIETPKFDFSTAIPAAKESAKTADLSSKPFGGISFGSSTQSSASLFNFSTNAPAVETPKFDFSSVASSKDTTASDVVQEKSSKDADTAPVDSAEGADANSATTV